MIKPAIVEQSAPSKPLKLLPGELTPEVTHNWENTCATYFISTHGTSHKYVMALKDTWLETHWDTKLWKKVLGSQQGSRAFYGWALELQNQTTLLYGNTTHLTDAQLQNQLEANICDDLMTLVLRVKLASTLTLKNWIEEVHHLDEK
ncbi:uncharacterized protein F5891DRAFT_977080 [Suillus fuscotomentosus]|uniref:Uncharacterized protein n=1 Tax=Suillus fuscotomentosus TaxID=1912939 RepID=A0AAD4EDD2_9AGAM|nr:uncharacterized protein F5891DRAFT_977080 [Suillus fuscotomentosus]KAG1904193.1 hypothetical protein F5891DRAFT_977080 [Suillus fuscotomentosus]